MATWTDATGRWVLKSSNLRWPTLLSMAVEVSIAVEVHPPFRFWVLGSEAETLSGNSGPRASVAYVGGIFDWVNRANRSVHSTHETGV
jgi:hypothetical protein